MTTYKLSRTGQAPLVFEGEELARVDGKWSAGREQNRYHNLAVYRTAGGNYILQVEYITQWQGEQRHDHVIVLGQDLSELANALREYDPCTRVQGYPPGPQYAEKQDRLLTSMRSRYDEQVSALLDKIEGAEEVLP